MGINLLKASQELSNLELICDTDNLKASVLWFRIMKQEGEWFIPMHKHSSFEFHFVSVGGYQVITDNNQFDISAGQFYLTSPGVFHKQISNHHRECIEYSINLDLVLKNKLITEESQILNILLETTCKPYPNIIHILKLFDVALQEAYDKDIGYYNKIKNTVWQILVETTRIIKDKSMDYNVTSKYKKYDYRFIQIDRYIKDNLGSPLTTKEIAAYMYLSDKQVTRIIKKELGISTKEYICTLKFQYAKELLENPYLSIFEVSEQLGFSSQYYFNEFFKIRQGCSPSFYRKKINKIS